MRHVGAHAVGKLLDELILAVRHTFLLGAGFQVLADADVQVNQAVQFQGFGKFIVQCGHGLGLDVHDLDLQGAGFLALAGNGYFHLGPGGLREQGVANARLGTLEVDGVRLSGVLTLEDFDGHQVFGFDGAIHGIVTGSTLAQVLDGLGHIVIADGGRGGFNREALPDGQRDFRVVFGVHGEFKRVALVQITRRDGGRDRQQGEFLHSLRVRLPEQEFAHLGDHVILADTLFQHALGGLAGTETRHANLPGKCVVDANKGFAHLVGGDGHFELHLVAVAFQQFCHSRLLILLFFNASDTRVVHAAIASRAGGGLVRGEGLEPSRLPTRS